MRLSDVTREHLMAAALPLFAERGYHATTVRQIVTMANANVAAISYHFRSKDGLYLEILKRGFAELERGLVGRSAWESEAVEPEERIRRFVRGRVAPLLRSDRPSLYMKVMAWEGIQPSGLLPAFEDGAILPHMQQTGDLVRPFLPDDADDFEVLVTAVWLIGQCMIFHRAGAMLARHHAGPPADVPDLMADRVATLAIAGLRAMRGCAIEDRALAR